MCSLVSHSGGGSGCSDDDEDEDAMMEEKSRWFPARKSCTILYHYRTISSIINPQVCRRSGKAVSRDINGAYFTNRDKGILEHYSIDLSHPSLFSRICLDSRGRNKQ